MSFTLTELAAALDLSAPPIVIKELTLDSRNVTAGTLFMAVKGLNSDGRDFISQALHSGAAAVMFEVDCPEQAGLDPEDSRLLGVYQLAKHLSALAGLFYGHPSWHQQLIGVTGTNGKSTTTQLIANWSDLLGTPAGVLGTLGNGLYGQLTAAVNTTGSPLEIQSQLAKLATLGAKRFAIEVSSHGLHQHRVAGLNFAVAVFTNLSRDHLDYHHTMANYAAAKRQLFEQCTQQYVINADDPVGRSWLVDYPSAIAYSLHGKLADYAGPQLIGQTVHFSSEGVHVTINSDWGNGVLSAPLLGRFNVSNLLAAMGALLAAGESFERLLATAPQLSGVAGRMEPFVAKDKPLVVVDYAHSPDALEQVLQALRQHNKGRLWCLVGCGGDRDQGKRPLMAQAAEQGADQVILTDDNPRTESASAIIKEMQHGLMTPSAVQIIHNRAQAIDYAITHAEVDDIILVAGKGHEDYQIVGKEKFHYSDRETVANLLGLSL